MEINRSFWAGLSVGVLLVLIICVLWWPRPEQPPVVDKDEVQLVVRYTVNKITGKLVSEFEDGSGTRGKRLEEIPLQDPGNPLGERAKGKEALAGNTAVTFAVKKNPVCLESCIGNVCATICK